MVQTESDRDSVEPEVSSYKLLEVRYGIGGLIEEKDLKLLQERNGDPRKKSFQVSISTLESKPAEVRECDVGQDRRTQRLALNAIVGVKGDSKYLEMRHV